MIKKHNISQRVLGWVLIDVSSGIIHQKVDIPSERYQQNNQASWLLQKQVFKSYNITDKCCDTGASIVKKGQYRNDSFMKYFLICLVKNKVAHL